MRPVKDFSGTWNPQRNAIHFKWDVSAIGNDRYIYIVGLLEENGVYRPDTSRFKLFDIRDMSNPNPSSTFMPINNLKAGVHRMLFCAYSTPGAANVNGDELMAACQSDSAYMTGVMMGRANIVYVADTSVAENAKLVKLHLKSDSGIAQGVLGYKYYLDNCEVINPFPHAINRGKTVFPPILIPKDSELQIGPLDRQFAGNLSITSKKSTLFF